MRITYKIAIISVFSVAVIMTGGCVSSGTYQAKEQESIQLSRNLEQTKGAYQELEDKNKKLLDEGELLNAKIKKLDSEVAELKLNNDKLKDDNEKLKTGIEKLKIDSDKLKADNDKWKLENEKLSLAVKPENIFKTLADYFAGLESENAKLKQALASAEKLSSRKLSEPPVKLDPLIVKPVAAVAGESSGKQTENSEAVIESVGQPRDSSGKLNEWKSKELQLQPSAVDEKLPKEPAAELK